MIDDKPKYSFLITRLDRLRLLRTIVCSRGTSGLDMHIKQLPILEYVRRHDGCTQIELAEAMLVSAQSVATSTKRMENAGLISKHTDDSNLRCKQLHITEKGLMVSQECRRVFDEIDEKMCADVTEEEMNILCAVLDKLSQNLSTGDLESISLCDLRRKSSKSLR